MTVSAVPADLVRTRLKGIGYMCLAMVFWAVVESMARYLSRPYSSYQVVWTRYTTHLIFMLIVFGPRYRKRLVATPRFGWQIGRALMMLGMPACFVLAAGRMPHNAVMAVFLIAPLVIMVLAAPWLHERVGGAYWLFTLVAFGGMLVLLQPTGLTLTGTLLAFGMALCFALYLLLSRRLRNESIVTGLFYTALGVWAPLSVGLPFFWRTPTLPDLAIMAAIGLLGLGALYTLDRAVELMPAMRAAPFIYLLPILLMAGGVLAGVMPGALLGSAIILGSGLVFVLLNTRETEKA
jgi:drug/metabolite transporter (DMT)-like permease